MVDSDALFKKDITIFSEVDDFIIQKNDKFFSLHKSTGKISKMDYQPKIGSGFQVHSILGMIDGKNQNYIVGAIKTKFVGSILTAKVFKIEELVFVSSSGGLIHEEDAKYLDMIRDFLIRNGLYYSDAYDLTVNIQLTFSNKTEVKLPGVNTFKHTYIFKNTIEHFCWNYKMATNFDHPEFESIIYPVINGVFAMREISDYKKEFSYIVLARKDTRRSGMRFLVRGSDKSGRTANFVETEEIICTRVDQEGKINVMSYHQLRGSIPLQWKQEPNLELNPKIVPYDNFQQNSFVFKQHLNELINNYGKTVIVNLIDKQKDQKLIGDYLYNIYKDFKENKSKHIFYLLFN
jgi:hypothetical protein